MKIQLTKHIPLRSRMIGATKWVVVGSSIRHVISLGSNLILTRLLMPEMFGLMSIAVTVGVIMIMLADIGLRQAVIRSDRGDELTFLNTAWTMQVCQGFILWGGSIIVALVLAVADALRWIDSKSTYGDPLLPWLIAATGFYSVLNGLASTLALSSTRHFNLRPIYLLDFIGQLFGLVVVVTLALLTKSIWSLVLGSIASIGISAILSHVWMKGARNTFTWDIGSVREIYNYGKWLAVSSALTVFASNGDRLLLAAYANAATLGLYSIALSLVGAVESVLNQLFERVMLPTFSEVARNNPVNIPKAYFRLRLRIDPIILISSGLLFGSADFLISLMYDARYAGASLMLQILSLGMILSRYNLVQQVYLALGQTQYFVWLNIFRLISTFTLIPIGYYFFDFFGALIATAFRNTPMVFLTFYYNSRHSLNNFRLEIVTLLYFPLGYSITKSFNYLFAL